MRLSGLAVRVTPSDCVMTDIGHLHIQALRRPDLVRDWEMLLFREDIECKYRSVGDEAWNHGRQARPCVSQRGKGKTSNTTLEHVWETFETINWPTLTTAFKLASMFHPVS
jgi:hypothetical protein